MSDKEELKNRLKNSLQFKLGSVTKFSYKRLNLELAKANIPVLAEQIPILMVIYLDSALSQQEIANLLQRDKAGIQRTVQVLVKDGFLRIEGDPNDKRKNLIYLTASGRFVCDKVKEIAFEFNTLIENNLTGDELATLIRLLDKVAAIVEI